MPVNPLKNAITPKRTPQEHCDEGNARIAAMGRRDIHWVVRDGRPNLEWATAPVGRMFDGFSAQTIDNEPQY